jgi:hypothetical protein
MHAVLDLLQQSCAIRRRQRRQVEAGRPAGRGASYYVQVLATGQADVRRAAAARAEFQRDRLAIDRQRYRDIGRDRCAFERQDVEQQRVGSGLGGAQRESDQHRARAAGERQVAILRYAWTRWLPSDLGLSGTHRRTEQLRDDNHDACEQRQAQPSRAGVSRRYPSEP